MGVFLCRLAGDGAVLEAREQARVPGADRAGIFIQDAGDVVPATSFDVAEGQELAVRYRLSLEKTDGADNRFRWKQGAKLYPYGLWLLKDAHRQGFVILCEGESDTHTLLFNNLPGLGLPGANSWQEEWADYLDMRKAGAVIQINKSA